MKTGLSESIAGNEPNDAALKSAPTLSTLTLRFVTLLSVIVILATWAWSR